MDCKTCHADVTGHKKIHAAVQMGCAVCHSGINASSIPHKIENKMAKGLSAKLPDLCFNCHDVKAFTGKEHVHPPVKSGLCTGCHSPHGGEVERLLLAEMPVICFNCHDGSQFDDKVVHEPAKIGLCLSCHLPHQSDREKLLAKDLPELCITCHDDKLLSGKNLHAPVDGGMCSICHGVHAAKGKYLLREKNAIDVCLACHTEYRSSPHVIAGISGPGHPS
jgi:predicted CXXCH cytochrome family protein